MPAIRGRERAKRPAAHLVRKLQKLQSTAGSRPTSHEVNPMNTPLQITFRDMAPSTALVQDAQDALHKLEEHHDRLTACRVVIQGPHKHQRQGRRFQVTITLAIPGRDLVVSRSHEDRASHEDAHLALREAFRALRRSLDRHLESRHASERHGGRTPARAAG
jgi:ribosome-associated translation inhibitor RaiA